jgi:hypothetical protein
MKRVIIFSFLFLLTTFCFSQTWESITVTIDGQQRTFTVRTDMYILRLNSFHLETNPQSGAKLLIWRQATWITGEGRWSEWENREVAPANDSFTKNTLIAIVRELRGNATYFETGTGKLLCVWTESNSREYWWENDNYLMSQETIYMVR